MDDAERERDENVGEGAARAAALDFPVVGVGASAGGVEAMRKFFAAVPAEPGMAFVAVLHLSPDHLSNLASMLGKISKLPVQEVRGDTAIEVNRIYVIVPDTALTMEGGVLRAGPAGARPRHPIDTLFASLAEEQREKAVAVVLSGTGTNGASGVLSIKENGGLVVVQDPETAEYTGMPSATLGTGVADLVLTPEQMPGELIAYLQQPYVVAPRQAGQLQDGEEAALNALLALVRTRSGFDFRGYKNGTLLRRIRRRMGLGQVASMTGYVEVLRDRPDELEALARDLLINVTSFFRDREAWETL
jgi:two-component system CheB/CheR fusion protein